MCLSNAISHLKRPCVLPVGHLKRPCVLPVGHKTISGNTTVIEDDSLIVLSQEL